MATHRRPLVAFAYLGFPADSLRSPLNLYELEQHLETGRVENTGGVVRCLLAIHKDEGSCYRVTVPDVPGGFSAGDTLEEAMAQASEAIFGHLALMLDDGQVFPAAQPFEVHRANPEYADAI